jgi:hypothetical protein
MYVFSWNENPLDFCARQRERQPAQAHVPDKTGRNFDVLRGDAVLQLQQANEIFARQTVVAA